MGSTQPDLREVYVEAGEKRENLEAGEKREEFVQVGKKEILVNRMNWCKWMNWKDLWKQVVEEKEVN